MAREGSWTQDRNFSKYHHRRAAKWYQQRTTPFYTSRPSARMEKQLAEEAERQWQSQNLAEGVRKRCAKVNRMPWISYAQTSARLRLALKGHDAINIADEGLCNPDCAIFACCLPFYGVLISRLQSTIRALYDIDGSEVRDWKDGCCCPCFALVRAEKEIILRESKKHLKDLEQPMVSETLEDTYTSQPPMEVLAPLPLQATGPPRARSSSTSSSKGKDIDRSNNSLSTIPEVSREASGAGITGDDGPGRFMAKKSARSHALDEDATVLQPTSKTTFPLLNYLDKQWFLVPAGDMKENIKPDEPTIEIVEEAPIEAKPSERGLWSFLRRNKAPKGTDVVVKHILADDTRSSRPPTITLKHALKEDAPTARSHGSRFAEHLIEHDRISPSMVPTINVSHELSDDPVFSLPAETDAGKHELSEHQPPSDKRVDTIATHTLGGDEQPDLSPEPNTSSQDETETVAQDKGFVATLLSGIAQPLRSTQSSSAAIGTSEPSDKPEIRHEPDPKNSSVATTHELADDEMVTR